MEKMAYRPEEMAQEAPGAEGGHVYFDSCQEQVICDLGQWELSASGRLMDVALTLKNVCPGRRVALGVTVQEMDAQGRAYPRGFQAVTVPAHHQSGCCDVQAPGLRFVLPEDLRPECHGRRHFMVRATAHYVDSGVAF